jgi:hypothetical protein
MSGRRSGRIPRGHFSPLLAKGAPKRIQKLERRLTVAENAIIIFGARCQTAAIPKGSQNAVEKPARLDWPIGIDLPVRPRD